MLVCPSGLDLSISSVRLLRRELADGAKAARDAVAAADLGPTSLLALAHLRCGLAFAQLAAGFGIGLAAHRYVTEALEVLAALAPTVEEAVAAAAAMA